MAVKSASDWLGERSAGNSISTGNNQVARSSSQSSGGVQTATEWLSNSRYQPTQEDKRQTSGWGNWGKAPQTQKAAQDRQKIYQDNLNRLKTLDTDIKKANESAAAEYAAATRSSGGQPFAIDPAAFYGDAQNKLKQLQREKANLEAQNRSYERFLQGADQGMTAYANQSRGTVPGNDPLAALKNRDGGTPGDDIFAGSGQGYTGRGGSLGAQEDRLGVYRNASQQDRKNAADRMLRQETDANIANASGIRGDVNGWVVAGEGLARRILGQSGPVMTPEEDRTAAIIQEGENKAWNQLTDKEYAVYEQLRTTQGQQSADQYLDSLNNMLQMRQRDSEYQMQEDATPFQKFWQGAAVNAASLVTNAAGNITAGVDDLAHIATGREVDPYNAAHFGQIWTSKAREDTAKQIEEAIGPEKHPTLAKYAVNTYQGVMSMLDSAIGGTLMAEAYTPIMGLGAASSRARELYEQGATKEQVAMGAIGSGVLEALFEYISLDKFVGNFVEKPPKGFLDFIKKVLVQGGVEASEEFSTEIGNMLWDSLVRAEGSEQEQAIRQMVDSGMSESKARREALKSAAEDIWWAVYGGFISGAGMGAVGGSFNNWMAQQQYEQAGRQVYANSAGQQVLDQATAAGTDLSSSLWALANQKAGLTAEQFQKLDRGDQKKAARAIGRAYLDTVTQQSESTDKKNRQTFRDRVVQALKDNGASNVERAADVITKSTFDGDLSRSEKRVMDAVDGETIAEEVLQSREFREVYRTGRDAVRATTDLASDSDQAVNPRTIQAAKDSMVETAKKAEMPAEAITAMQDAWDTKQDPKRFAEGYAHAYQQGADGMAEVWAQKSIRTAGMTEEQIRAAWEAGRKAEGYGEEADMGVPGGEEWNDRSGTSRAEAAAEGSAAEGKAEGNAEGKVSVKALGIEGGAETRNLTVKAEDDYTEGEKQLKQQAEEQGLKLKIVTGGSIVVDGVEARGCISGDTVLVRGDHKLFTSEQIGGHEIAHRLLDTGKLDRAEIREQLLKGYSEEQIDEIIDLYDQAYGDTGMLPEQIMDEILCDAYGKMNAFADPDSEAASLYAGEVGLFLRSVNAAEKNAKKIEQHADASSSNVNFSIEFTKAIPLKEQISKIYKSGGDGLRSNDALYFGEAPSSLEQIGIKGPLAMRQNDFKKSAKEKHNTKRRNFLALNDNLKNPMFAFEKDGLCAVVIDDYDGDGKRILVAIHTNKMASHNKVNLITSVYGIDNPGEWLVNQMAEKGNPIIFNEEKTNSFLHSYGYKASLKDGIRLLDGSILPSGGKVNGKETNLSREMEGLKDLKAQKRYLEQKVAKLQEQMKTTEYTSARADDVRRAAWKIRRGYGSKMDINEITDSFQKIADYVVSNNDGAGIQQKDLWDMARFSALEILQNAVVAEDAEGAKTDTWGLTVDQMTNDIINELTSDRVRVRPKTQADKIAEEAYQSGYEDAKEAERQEWEEYLGIRVAAEVAELKGNQAVAEAKYEQRLQERFDQREAKREQSYHKREQAREAYEQERFDRKEAARDKRVEKILDQNRQRNKEHKERYEERIERIERILDQNRKRNKERIERSKQTQTRQAIYKMADKFKRMAGVEASPGKGNTLHAPPQMLRAVAGFCEMFSEVKEADLAKRGEWASNSLEQLQARANAGEDVSKETSRWLQQEQKRNAAKASLAKAIEEYRELGKRNDAAYDERVEAMMQTLIGKLSGKSLYDLSSGELEEVHTAMKGILYQVQHVNDAFSMGEQKKVSGVANGIWNAMRQVNAKGPGMQSYMQRFWLWQMTLDNFFNTICGYIKGNEGQTVKAAFVKGGQKMLEVQREYGDAFAQFTRSKDKAVQKELRGLMTDQAAQKKMVSIGLTDQDGNDVKVSRGMMLSVYMMLDQEDSRRSLAVGGFRVPDMATYYKGKTQQAYGDMEDSRMIAGGLGQEYRDLLQQRSEILNQLDELEDNEANAEQRQGLIQQLRGLKDQAEAMVGGQEYNLVKMRSQIYSMMTPMERALVQTAKNWMGRTGEMMKETFVKMNGYEPVMVKNYWPIHRDMASLQVDIRTNQDAEKAFNLEGSGFTKERVRSTQPILLTDFFAELNQQSSKMSRYVGFAQVQKDFGKIWKVRLENGRTLNQMVQSKFGQGKSGLGVSGEEYINHFIQDIAGGAKSDDILSTFYGNAAAATLQMNGRVAASQFASVPTAAAEVGWKNAAIGFGKGIKNAFSTEYKNQLAEKNAYFYNRYRGEGGRQELSDFQARGGIIGRAASSKVGKALFNWCQNVDVMATGSIMWEMAAAQAKENGAKATDADYEARVNEIYTNIIRHTQPNYTVTERSDMLRDKRGGMKLLTMYKTQSNQNLNILIAANGEFIRMKQDLKAGGRNGVTEADLKAAQKKLANAYTSVFLGGTGVFVLIRTAINFLMHAVDPYREKETNEVTGEAVMKRAAQEMASSVAGMVALGGPLYDAIFAVVSGENYYGLSDSAISNLSGVLENSVKTLQAAIDKDKEVTPQQWKKLAQSMGMATGIPVGNAMKFWEDFEGWYNDARNGEMGKFGSSNTTKKQYQARFVSAYEEGDEEKANELLAYLMANYTDATVDSRMEAEVRNEMNTYLKGEYLDGKMDDEEALGIMTEYLDMDKKDAKAKILTWQGILETGYTETEMAERYYTRAATGQEYIEYLMKYMGKDAAYARKKEQKMRCGRDTGIDYNDINDLVLSGKLSAQKAVQLMVKYGGESQEDAKNKVDKLLWQKDVRGFDSAMQPDTIGKYNTYCAGTGMSRQIFYDFWDWKRKTEHSSRKAVLLEKIASLPISDAQKRGLWQSFHGNSKGWTKYPWSMI